MNVKACFPCAVILTVLGWCVARADDAPVSPDDGTAAEAPAEKVPPPASVGESLPAEAGVGGLSNWILYHRPDCCGPFGAHGPINTELYLRSGPTIPVGGNALDHVLGTGWEIQGGGRSLFFNPTVDRAWAVDVSISYMYNHDDNQAVTFPLVLLPPPPGTPPATFLVSPKAIHRTFFNVGGGREWYLTGPANSSGAKLRFGIDGGGRIGSERMDIALGPPFLRHRNDVISGLYAAAHTDLEIPCGCCTFLAGFRAEYGYTFSDILQNNDADIQDLNLLVNLGVRF